MSTAGCEVAARAIARDCAAAYARARRINGVVPFFAEAERVVLLLNLGSVERGGPRLEVVALVWDALERFHGERSGCVVRDHLGGGEKVVADARP